MPELVPPSAQMLDKLRNEVERQNKIIRALMNRAERSTVANGSDFDLLQTAIMLEEQVGKRTEDLQAALAANKQITLDLQKAKAQMEIEITERKRAQVALESANQRLEELTLTDALTGLPNRRRFDETLSAEWRRGLRQQASLGLAMIDIDKFKQYNDQYGHLLGDECLRRVASTIRSILRRGGEMAARYGGEEFVMVLPHTELSTALLLAERARAAVAQLNEPHIKSDFGKVTISLGVAAVTPCTQITPEQLLQAADAALYEAKQCGRNRVGSSDSFA